MAKKKQIQQIKHRHTHEVIFESEGTMTEVIKKAIKQDVDLRSAEFRTVDGNMWELGKINWKGKDLTNIDLRYCVAHGQNFKGCNLSKATLCRSDFTGSDFEGSDFTKTMMAPTIVEGCKFKDVNLVDAEFIDFTDFSKAMGVKI